jgi:maleate isomerase
MRTKTEPIPTARPSGARTRRGFLAAALSSAASGALAACARGLPARAAPPPVGALSGRPLRVADANAPPMPAIAAPGVVHDGEPTDRVVIDPSRGHPDVRSWRRKFGLLIPATNTSMEHELWSILVKNQGEGPLDGVGLHTANVITPRPALRTEADLREYQRQFLGGLRAAVEQVMLAGPQYLVMGMSLEHILHGIEPIRAVMAEAEAQSGLSWATWHDAAPAALARFGARRIGLLTPFDRLGNQNAIRMFTDLGYEVVSNVGFSCANAMHIAHIPNEAKEKAITELLATRPNRLDAIVQCGTNMSMLDVTERLEPKLGIPVLGINAVTFWYALRENGFAAPLAGGGRLLREH